MKQVKWPISLSTAYTDKLNMDYCPLILQVSSKLVELQRFNRFSFAFGFDFGLGKKKGKQQWHPKRSSGDSFLKYWFLKWEMERFAMKWNWVRKTFFTFFPFSTSFWAFKGEIWWFFVVHWECLEKIVWIALSNLQIQNVVRCKFGIWFNFPSKKKNVSLLKMWEC